MTGKMKQPGLEPDRLKIEGDWKDAVKQALKKKRPVLGWPRPQKKGRAKKDAR